MIFVRLLERQDKIEAKKTPTEFIGRILQLQLQV